jgi:hypothetical protein
MKKISVLSLEILKLIFYENHVQQPIEMCFIHIILLIDKMCDIPVSFCTTEQCEVNVYLFDI